MWCDLTGRWIRCNFVSHTPNYFHTSEFPWFRFATDVQSLLNGHVRIVLIPHTQHGSESVQGNRHVLKLPPHGVSVKFWVAESELISVAIITSESTKSRLFSLFFGMGWTKTNRMAVLNNGQVQHICLTVVSYKSQLLQQWWQVEISANLLVWLQSIINIKCESSVEFWILHQTSLVLSLTFSSKVINN